MNTNQPAPTPTPDLDSLRKAAEQGDAEAQYNLACIYFSGKGAPMDRAGAAQWFRKAADQGHAGAQNSVGDIYYSGKGLPKDRAQAATWYRKAADQGHVEAQNRLGYMYYYGDGVTKDHAEAAKWYLAAAEQDHAGAQYDISFMYERGEGVPLNHAEAAKWYARHTENKAKPQPAPPPTQTADFWTYFGKAVELSVKAKAYIGKVAAPLLARIPAPGNLKRAARIVFRNNYGLLPRQYDSSKYSHTNISGFNIFDTIMRVFYFTSWFWILPGLLALFYVVPMFRFLIMNPPPAPVELRRDIQLTLTRDTITLSNAPVDLNKYLKDLPEEIRSKMTPAEVKQFARQQVDYSPIETKAVSKGKVVYPFFREFNTIYVEDTEGNRFNVDADEVNLSSKDFRKLREIRKIMRGGIYSDADVKRLMLGKTIQEIDKNLNFCAEVTKHADGTSTAYLIAHSTKDKSGKRKGTLALKTDARGVVTSYAFTGKDTSYCAIDYMPILSGIMDTALMRRFTRATDGSWTMTRGNIGNMNIKIGGQTYGGKFPLVIVNLILTLAMIFTVTCPFLLVPFLFVLAALIDRKQYSNKKIVFLGSLAGIPFFLAGSFVILLSSDTLGGLSVTVPALLLFYLVFIPEISRELHVMRCDCCIAWDSYFYNGNSRKSDQITRTTKTKKVDGREEVLSVTETQVKTDDYECAECHHVVSHSYDVPYVK